MVAVGFVAFWPASCQRTCMGPCRTLDTPRSAEGRRRALARLAPALLSLIATRASVARVALAMADCLPPTVQARRVAIGLSSAPTEPVRLLAVSGQASVDPRRRAAKRIEACLQAVTGTDTAASVQDAGIRIWPGEPLSNDRLEAALSRVARGCGASTLACLTLHEPSGGRLVLLFDRAEESAPFAAQELMPLRTQLPDVAEWMAERARHQGPWRMRARGAWRRRGRPTSRWHRILPNGLTGRVSPRGFVIATSIVAVLLLGSLPVPRTVTARATLESADRQAISAARDGHLIAVHARAGDRVEKGELLAQLDDRDARDAQRALQESAARIEEELSRALAVRDRTSLGRLRAEQASIAVDQAASERAVQQARVTAPFTGLLLAGDPGERLGAPIDAGEILFELGTEHNDRLTLEIDERDVRLVEPGLSARVRMAGLPMTVWLAELQALEPVAIAEPGRNVFRMPATLAGDSDDLRPGMQGVARIDTGRQALAAVWTRSLRERLTLIAWRIGIVR